MIELTLYNYHATNRQLSNMLDEINHPTKKKNVFGFDLNYIGTRYNSIGVKTMGKNYFIVKCSKEYNKGFFISRKEKEKRFWLYTKGNDILEKMTEFILRNAAKEQVKDWEEYRKSLTITIKKEDHPLLLESLYEYYKNYNFYL